MDNSNNKDDHSGFNRREFMGATALGAVAVALGELALPKNAVAAAVAPSTTVVPATLPNLPWADTALEPTITAKTLSFHYGKHHKTYLTNLQTLLADENSKVAVALKGKSLEQIILATYNKKDTASIAIFRNAAQVYNHDFYWKSLTPNGGGVPTGEIATLITQAFTDYATFRTKLIDAAVAQFGTGWAWVVLNNKKQLQIVTTGDADTPFTTSGLKPLLTIDVWEHAYYLDYQNGRKTYVTAVVDKLLNWSFANQNLASH